MVSFVNRHQACRIQWTIDDKQIILGKIQMLEKLFTNVERAIRGNFETNGISLAPVVQFIFHSLEKVHSLLLLDIKLGIPGHPKIPEAQNVGAGENVSKIGSNDVAEKNVF